jgi:polar amino acid transport system permease protein
MYQWDFSWVWLYKGQLAQALGVTIILKALVLALGSAVGLGLGLASLHRFVVTRLLVRAYVDLFRTLPVLVLMVWFFFCAPILFNVRISGFASAVIVLALNLSAFVAEIVRAGLQAVPQIHIEDAQALGLSKRAIAVRVRMPIALRIMVPPLVGQYINTIKLSVLASVIAVPELLQRTTDLISQVYRPLEFYTALALIFLALLLPGTLWSRRLESQQSPIATPRPTVTS